ncbi:MAG: S49 family peptidase [Gemmatimonadaceae bacterium]
MSRSPAHNALQLMTSHRWAIRREALDRMVALAERDVDAMLAAAVRASEDGEAIDTDKLRRRQSLFSAPAVEHPQSERLGVRDHVAILPIVGPLCRYASFFQEVCGLTSYQLAAQDFMIAINDPSIHAILVHLDSPGGEVDGCSELAALIHANRGVKPIVAMVSDGAASAAYWIAAACDEIVVTSAAYVGSIGVYWEIVDFSEAEKAEGVRRFRIVSSQSPNKVPDPSDDAGKAVLQREVDQFADAFLEATAEYRKTDVATLIAAGDGGAVFIGRHAVERGLADRVGTTEELLSELSAREFNPPAMAHAARAARTTAHTTEPLMAKTKPAGATASGPRAYAAGDEIRSLIGREATIAEGATGTVEEVRENVTVIAIRTDDGDCRWLLADEEVELANAPAEKPADEQPPADAPAATEEEEDPAAITSIAKLAQRYPALVGQLRQGAAKAERTRVLALCALEPRAIATTLKAAIEGGHTAGKTAKAMLEASRQPGADALSAMVGAEGTIEAPTPLASTGESKQSDAKAITALLEIHTRRGRASRPSSN